MNNLQDVREVHKMWEYKFQNAAREGIDLSTGKPRSLFSLLGRIINSVTAKPAVSGGNLREEYQPV